MRSIARLVCFAWILSLCGAACVAAAANLGHDHPEPVSEEPDSLAVEEEETTKVNDKGLPLIPGRSIAISTNEGTWMALDVSPDGKHVVFELLGDLYRVPLEGGAAEQLTSGLAFDSQPRYSPDGSQLVFTSDRTGGENLWLLTLADRDSTQLTKGKKHRYQSPEWTPDGKYILASKSGRRYGRPKLWMWHVEGGSGIQLIKDPKNLKTTGAAFGADARYIWFAQRDGGWQYNAQFPQYQLAVYDRDDGSTAQRTSRYGSGFCPTLSPDGRWLVYGTRHDKDTGLILRNLASGDEDWLAYPVQHDAQEGRATRDVLPSMSFTPDSREVVASYGGRIWRIPVDGSAAIEVPFQVNTQLPLGPQLEFEYPISDDPKMLARQIRHAKPSPDGKRLVFTALDRVYVMDLPNGTARRLTRSNESEQQPTWTADGKTVVYSTWTITGGHLKSIRVGGSPGNPTTLTKMNGVYRSPAVSPDGKRIVALRNATRSMQQSTGPVFSRSETDLIWLPLKGGDFVVITAADGRVAPHFSNNPQRIFLFHGDRGLVSIQWDGTDERSHLKVTGDKLPEQEDPFEADLILMGPNEKQALAYVINQLYTVTIPFAGKTPTISVSDPSSAAFPVRRLTDIGGQFPTWNHDGTRVHWSMGNAHLTYDLTLAQAADDSAKAADKVAEKEKLEKEKAKKDKDLDSGAPDDSLQVDTEDDQDKKENDKEDKDKKKKPLYEPTELRVRIEFDRDLPQGTVLLQGARVITMNGKEIFESGDVLVHNNRIQAVGRSGSLDVPTNADVIDVRGKTMVPGFVDTHAHLRPAWGFHKLQPWQYLANLAFGVTTTRDPQTGTTDVLTYSDFVDQGQILGPRIYSTGPGVFWDEPLKDLEEARHIMRRYSDYYDTKTIKMYVAGNREQRQWLIIAARELQIMPTTEGSLNLKLNLTQILDGYPGHEHNFPVYPIYKDVLDLTNQSRTMYTPTLLVSYGGPFAENFWYTTEEVHDDAKLRRFTPHEVLDSSSLRRPWFRREQYVFEDQGVFVKNLAEAGGRLGVGSHGQLQGLGYHWELWSMAAGGLDAHDALRIATVIGADGLGLSGDLGSLEPGKLADLLILNGNPLEDLRNTNNIHRVMKNGRLYNADTLDEVWPRQKPLERQHWWAEEPQTAAGIR